MSRSRNALIFTPWRSLSPASPLSPERFDPHLSSPTSHFPLPMSRRSLPFFGRNELLPVYPSSLFSCHSALLFLSCGLPPCHSLLFANARSTMFFLTLPTTDPSISRGSKSFLPRKNTEQRPGAIGIRYSFERPSAYRGCDFSSRWLFPRTRDTSKHFHQSPRWHSFRCT